MNNFSKKILSIFLACIFLFAVSGHQLLYHICNAHGDYSVSYSFIVKGFDDQCVCDKHDHNVGSCCAHQSNACDNHHDDSKDLSFNNNDSCCDTFLKIFKITNPYQNVSKISLPTVSFIDLGSLFSFINISEIFQSLIKTFAKSPPNWLFSEFFNKSFLFTQFLF